MLTSVGKVEIANSNPQSEGSFGFQMSPYLQETAVFVGQENTYERGSHILKKTMGYVMADGSMIRTRAKEPWKEVKAGRAFKSSDCLKMDEKPSVIRHSQYVAHLGNRKGFTEKTDPLIESFGCLKERLVFIAEGAVWLRNWISDSYPEAISILDFFHASEYLYDYAKVVFKEDELKTKQWADRQKELLLDSRLQKVRENIREIAPCKSMAKKIIKYYQDNADRMDYKRYLPIGLGIIGSGAIESAHRTVVQKRLKLSGQRWTISGAQNMLNLRAIDMSHKWDKVIELAQTYHGKQVA